MTKLKVFVTEMSFFGLDQKTPRNSEVLIMLLK
jgi:hypothetical protein